MKEEYLHYIWREKKISFHKLRLIDGRELEVLNTGWYNVDSGPDFFNGMIKVDGIVWSGNIEMHLNSSDWFRHQHHHDHAYDNVVLHVVFNHDQEVCINGIEIPTLSLKDAIKPALYEKYKKLTSTNSLLPCSNTLKSKGLVEAQVQNSLQQRLHRKASELQVLYQEKGWTKKQVLSYAFMIAFGGRLNKIPLIELVNILPLSILVRESWNEKRVEAIILGCAGLLTYSKSADEYYTELCLEWRFMKQKHQLVEMNAVSWKFGGVRPYNFPTFKLAQLAKFISSWRFDIAFIHDKNVISLLRSLLSNPLSDYWENHFHFEKTTSKKHKTALSKKSKDLIIINALPTYLFFLSQLEGSYAYVNQALKILSDLPAEQNSIIKKWKEYDIPIKSAGDSQGLIELRNEFCNFRRCLSCVVGQNILKD